MASKVPDLHCIENVWDELVREVYQNGKQYNIRNDLIMTIRTAGFELCESYLQKL